MLFRVVEKKEKNRVQKNKKNLLCALFSLSKKTFSFDEFHTDPLRMISCVGAIEI
jgi:hypothetical protein